MRLSRLYMIPMLLCLILSLGLAAAAEDALGFETVPHVLRPGKNYDIAIQSPAADNASLVLCDPQGNALYTIFADYPLMAGKNLLVWDGVRLDYSIVEQGDYILRVVTAAQGQTDSPLRVGAPYPLITDIAQDSATATEDTAINISFIASEQGTLSVRLNSKASGTSVQLDTQPVDMGANTYTWAGNAAGAPVDAGEYALVMTLRTGNGIESMPQYVIVEKQSNEANEDIESGGIVVETTEAIGAVAAAEDLPEATEAEPEPTPEPTPEPPSISPPYSTINDGSFWSMTPGELDDKVIWDILTQPITVYDDGKIKGNEHVYLMENPDGSGAKVAQIHGKSQGLHILGEVNEHGYVLAEAFSNYDPDYQPTTDDERAHAFDLKQGYINASGLKTTDVHTDYAILIDKLTQRLYIFKDGERITELLIATGKIADNKYYNETIAGEYITVSHVGGFWSGNMYCDMAIRINGGILLHEVPHKVNADGSKNYSSFEAYLGTKQSHGCIRIQRQKNEDGYSHRWLWDNLDRKGGYKVIIWDDDPSRVDSPTTWYPNPKN